MRHQIIVPAIEVITMNNYRVVEKFVSINGEGQFAGMLSVFIRFAFCNLRCSYCDTMYANEPSASYEWLSEEQIVSYIKEQQVERVTLTGGEPLIQKQIHTLIQRLLSEGFLVEIETNGSVDLKPFSSPLRPYFTLDYKLPASDMESHMNLENYEIITKQDVVKFVISNQSDLEKAHKIVKQFDLIEKTQVYFSSVFSQISPSEIVDYMSRHHLNGIHFQLQMHKFIWPPEQRGV